MWQIVFIFVVFYPSEFYNFFESFRAFLVCLVKVLSSCQIHFGLAFFALNLFLLVFPFFLC